MKQEVDEEDITNQRGGSDYRNAPLLLDDISGEVGQIITQTLQVIR